MATRVTSDILEDQQGITGLIANFSKRMQKVQNSEGLSNECRRRCQRIMDVVGRAELFTEQSKVGLNKTCLDQLRYTIGLLPSQKENETQLAQTDLQNLYEATEFLRSFFGNSDNALGIPSVHPHFVAREELFDAMSTTFSKHDTLVLHGPSGIGKTETAIAYGHRNRDTYPFVWMIHAETIDQIVQSYRKLSEALDVQFRKEDNLKEIEKKVFTKLKESDVPCLLIYDNVTELIKFPQGVKVLLTTNDADKFSKYRKSAIQVSLFDDREALSLMERVTEEESEEFRGLVDRLGHYPLVLGLAAQSMRMQPDETRAAVGEALDGVDDKKMQEMLKAVLGQQLHKLPPLALEWLHVCSHLNSEDIPVSFIEIWLQTQHGLNIRESKQKARQILSILVNRGWLRMDHSTETFSIHRLFQVILKDKETESSYGQACRLLIKLWDKIDYKNFRNWENEFSLGEEFCSHTVSLLNDSRFATIPKEDQAKLYSRAAKFEYLQGKYEEALKKHEEALKIREEFLEKPLFIAASLVNVGSSLYALGRNEEALEKYKAALAHQQKSLDPKPLDIAETHHFIGNCLFCLGNYRDALGKYKEVLRIRDKSLDANHPTNAPILGSIGNCLYSLGKYRDAIKKYKKADAIWMEESSDLNQFAIAENLCLMGKCFFLLKNYKKALKKYEEALEIWQDSWEPNPGAIARALNSIGSCLEAQGRKAKASDWDSYEQAKALLVEDYPDAQRDLKKFNRT